MDRFVVIHQPCKVRVVRSADKREGYHYERIGPEDLDLWLEMDFELRGESDESETTNRTPWTTTIATD